MARPANPELSSEILRAATHIIETCGPDCVTMREVAEKIGYSPTTIYLYFKDKSEVLKGTVKLGFEDLAEMMASTAVGPTPLDKLRQRSRAYLVWGVMHPGLLQLMYQMPGDISWEPEELDHSLRAWTETAEVVKECVTTGAFAPVEDTDRLVTLLFAAWHGVASLATSRRIASDALAMSASELIEAASQVLDPLVEGVLTAAAPR